MPHAIGAINKRLIKVSTWLVANLNVNLIIVYMAMFHIIGLWGDNGQGLVYEPLLAHGTILPASTTAFAAEAIALDEATAAVKEMIRGSRT